MTDTEILLHTCHSLSTQLHAIICHPHACYMLSTCTSHVVHMVVYKHVSQPNILTPHQTSHTSMVTSITHETAGWKLINEEGIEELWT